MSHFVDKRQLSAGTIRLICSLGLNGGVSIRKIALRANVSPNTVIRTLNRAEAVGLKRIEQVNSLPEVELLNCFYPDLKPSLRVAPKTIDQNNKYVPDLDEIAQKMLEEHIGLQDVFNQYVDEAKAAGGTPFSKAYFYKRLEAITSELLRKDDFYLAQDFKYAENVEIDFGGDKFRLNTFGGIKECCLCVIVWPASYYTYAEFVSAQSTVESCRVFGNAVRYFGNKVPVFCVCDNARSWVSTHIGKDVSINPAFEDFMTSLGICIDAAPPHRPQAKAAVEYEVRLTQDLVRKHITDFNQHKTLVEHSKHLMELVEKNINEGPFRKSIDKTRSFLFHKYEQPIARAVTYIPEFEGEYRSMTVPRSYLLEIEGHFYSVPYSCIKQQVDVYLTNDFVSIKHESIEIARHLRSDKDGKQTIDPNHRPQVHKDILANSETPTEEKLLERCREFEDEALYNFCIKRLEYGRKHNNTANNYNAIRSCQGVLSFYQKSTHKDLVSVCCRKILLSEPSKWNTGYLKMLYIRETNNFNLTKAKSPGFELFIDNTGDKFYR